MGDKSEAKGARASKRRKRPASAMFLNPLLPIPPLTRVLYPCLPILPPSPPRSFRMGFLLPPLNLHLRPNLALTTQRGDLFPPCLDFIPLLI